MKVSIIIRTYNEAKRLPALLAGIARQATEDLEVETIVVDSGSTDDSVAICQRSGCRVERIRKADFSFGRSLNLGCGVAEGDLLVFVSGHCVPVDEHWLRKLVQPLVDGEAVCSFGRQIGNGDSHFSECQIFRKYYPERGGPTQEPFFVNNANAALVRSIWSAYRFDEELSGLEDMALG